MPRDQNTVLMEGVRIIFRNFAGKEGQYNREGDRNFSVVLDPRVAETLANDGWNVKQLEPRDEGEEVAFYLPVSAKYDAGRPPRIVLINSLGKRRKLDEDEVEILDWADITNVDLIVRPYAWSVSGRSGIKAYLQSMYVTIEEDALERKYAEMEE